MKQFTLKLTGIATFLGLISVVVFYGFTVLPISPVFPYILIFLYVSTLLIFLALEKSMKQRTSQFANAIMLVNFGKLVFYAVVIFVYAYFNRTDAVSFTLTFFIYYFVFTIFEVIALLSVGKK